MELTDVMEKLHKKPRKSKQPGEREDTGHYFYHKNPMDHQIRLAGSRFKTNQRR